MTTFQFQPRPFARRNEPTNHLSSHNTTNTHYTPTMFGFVSLCCLSLRPDIPSDRAKKLIDPLSRAAQDQGHRHALPQGQLAGLCASRLSSEAGVRQRHRTCHRGPGQRPLSADVPSPGRVRAEHHRGPAHPRPGPDHPGVRGPAKGFFHNRGRFERERGIEAVQAECREIPTTRGMLSRPFRASRCVLTREADGGLEQWQGHCWRGRVQDIEDAWPGYEMRA